MNTNGLEHIDKLTQLGTKAVEVAITEYTNYFLTSALCWEFIGVSMAITAIFLWKNKEKFVGGAVFAMGGLLILSIFIIAHNLPTLISPKAYAIHQLITDSR